MTDASGASAEKDYDLVVFGAAGFTGQYVVEELMKKAPPVTWAVAGRNANKLRNAVQQAFQVTGQSVKEIPVIIADVSDEHSLGEMCKRAKVILNCVGPYRFYGEPVVKACIAEKAHYVDISGEPEYLERIQLEYNDAAREAGVYIVGATGFDSIPIEAGIRFLRNKFPGDLNSVDTYFSTESGEQGVTLNFGTWQSAIHSYANSGELRSFREKLFPDPLPKRKYRAPARKGLFYSNETQGWCLPFLGPDESVVQRTQYYLYHQKKIRPFQVNTYFRISSFCNALGIVFLGLVFVTFACCSWGRKLLEKYPRFFSFGLFSKEGPTREQIMATSFTTTLVGIGYKENLREPTDEHANPPDTKIIVKVKGPEYAYVTTPICMVQSALVILQEKAKLPDGGGVYTAGAVFDSSTLLERLSKNGLQFISEAVTDV